MAHFTKSDINDLDRLIRLCLVNSITGYKPANLIGTVNGDGLTNLAIISSVVHMGSDPAILGFFMRPMVTERHTMENIQETGFYTINHVHETIAEKAHFTSADFSREESEFDMCQLQAEFKDGFAAPYVSESRVQIGMQLAEKMDISLNKTILIIGYVEHIYIQDAGYPAPGVVDLNAVGTICISGLDTYHNVSKIATFPYARPNNIPEF